jgi:hypothetical protein
MRKIINEQSISNSDKQIINGLIKTNSQKAKSHYINHFSEQETINKFNKPSNVSIIKSFIPTIGYKPFVKTSGGQNGFVNKNNPKTINLNLYYLITKNGKTFSPKGSLLYDTILHEMGHLIDFKLQTLGEKSLTNSTGYYRPTDGTDNYVQSDVETFARIQRLREVLDVGSNANGTEIKNKIVEFIKSKKIQFPNVRIMGDDRNSGILIFEQINQSKGVLTDLWTFYSPLKINNTSVPDISALFAKYSKIVNRKVILDLNLIGKVNASAKGVVKLTQRKRKVNKMQHGGMLNIDYNKLISLIKAADNPKNLPIYYNSDQNVINIGGVGYDKGDLVKMFNSQPGQSSDIKSLFYKANQHPNETKKAIESMNKGIKIRIGYGYGNEPFVEYMK